jgi:glutathione S-transferase
MLTLYDDVFSPYARKVRIALYEKDARVGREERLRAVAARRDARRARVLPARYFPKRLSVT